MVANAVEEMVIKWQEDNYNPKPLFAKSRPVPTYDTSLTIGKYPWASETAEEIMWNYFSRFKMDGS
ncbi:MAG: hypothetical protein QM578_24305 [Pantoea sp.]|uniref:hypothetical protein n=1 Tax=Pantoea sp. TaxID=69393 RepID=UPI0039E2B8C3